MKLYLGPKLSLILYSLLFTISVVITKSWKQMFSVIFTVCSWPSVHTIMFSTLLFGSRNKACLVMWKEDLNDFHNHSHGDFHLFLILWFWVVKSPRLSKTYMMLLKGQWQLHSVFTITFHMLKSMTPQSQVTSQKIKLQDFLLDVQSCTPGVIRFQGTQI